MKDKIKETVNNITSLDNILMQAAQRRLDNLTKPLGSLGRLEELAKLIVGITGQESPVLKNKVIFTLAADHGVTEEGVSFYPKEVTAQMVYNFLSGGAAINVLARHVGARVIVVDMGVASTVIARSECDEAIPKKHDCFAPSGLAMTNSFKNKKIALGTKNMARGAAMSREEAVKSIEAGIDILEEEFSRGVDIIGTGEMGIGNTTAASAITAVFTKKLVDNLTGRGAGLDNQGLQNKIEIIKKVLKVNNPNPNDPIDVLAKVGGFEIGGLAGIILAAASRKIPVVIDGFISGAAALIAYHIEPKSKDYMIAAHCSVERGHRIILEHIGLKPLLDLNMRLGEGTGGCLGINLAEASVNILTQMATFKSAGVSERK
ncbi:MAG: nicotinate-nucleotide--dimethylbenzimidazole phosphoribosyltransferase [Candidatus Omnitrophica bacterium]|nr:nicotinate-nucleotide--dimethylbenzimidazole phosphoribosyltransferase [Candidatus Omnitrophota bacterium]